MFIDQRVTNDLISLIRTCIVLVLRLDPVGPRVDIVKVIGDGRNSGLLRLTDPSDDLVP